MLNQEQRDFLAYHRREPHVYLVFERLGLDRHAEHPAARQGARFLLEAVRWELRPTTGDPYAINDHLVPFYARLLIARHPYLDGIFELRRSAADEASCNQPTLWEDAAAGEGWLEQAMRILDEYEHDETRRTQAAT